MMESVQVNWDSKEHTLNIALSERLDAASGSDVEKEGPLIS